MLPPRCVTQGWRLPSLGLDSSFCGKAPIRAGWREGAPHPPSRAEDSMMSAAVISMGSPCLPLRSLPRYIFMVLTLEQLQRGTGRGWGEKAVPAVPLFTAYHPKHHFLSCQSAPSQAPLISGFSVGRRQPGHEARSQKAGDHPSGVPGRGRDWSRVSNTCSQCPLFVE